MAWFVGGENGDPPKVPEEGEEFGVIFRLDDTVEGYTIDGMSEGWLEHGYFAMGSGAAIALGAMGAEADPEKAVELASRHDALTRGPITVLRRE